MCPLEVAVDSWSDRFAPKRRSSVSPSKISALSWSHVFLAASSGDWGSFTPTLTGSASWSLASSLVWRYRGPSSWKRRSCHHRCFRRQLVKWRSIREGSCQQRSCCMKASARKLVEYLNRGPLDQAAIETKAWKVPGHRYSRASCSQLDNSLY